MEEIAVHRNPSLRLIFSTRELAEQGRRDLASLAPLSATRSNNIFIIFFAPLRCLAGRREEAHANVRNMQFVQKQKPCSAQTRTAPYLGAERNAPHKVACFPQPGCASPH